MDCIVHGVTKTQTQLSDFHFHFFFSTFLEQAQRGSVMAVWISKEAQWAFITSEVMSSNLGNRIHSLD